MLREFWRGVTGRGDDALTVGAFAYRPVPLAQGLDRSASILSLTYTETRGELGADLLVRDYDELERMKQRLSQMGVAVEITSAEQQDSGVRARIRLRGEAG